MKRIFILLLAQWLTSCASVHPGRMGLSAVNEAKILVSAETQSDCADDHYSVVVFTFENKGDEILRVTSTDIGFGPGGETKASVLVGKDLAAWGEACELERKNKEHNKSIGQMALLVGGAALAIVGVSTSNSSTKLIGEGAMVAGGAWAVTDQIGKAKDEAHRPRGVPETHVYAPFSVPIEKFVRRWAVIQKKDKQELKTLSLNVRLADNSTRTYEFKLED